VALRHPVEGAVAHLQTSSIWGNTIKAEYFDNVTM
jgi:hypothetical protein